MTIFFWHVAQETLKGDSVSISLLTGLSLLSGAQRSAHAARLFSSGFPSSVVSATLTCFIKSFLPSFFTLVLSFSDYTFPSLLQNSETRSGKAGHSLGAVRNDVGRETMDALSGFTVATEAFRELRF